MRRGFTIIELLVVITILAMLMGLTLGGIAAMRKTDKLLATEHLVGDVIRQARHTARTSGQPVSVSIRTVDGKGVIAGISRVPVWCEGFDSTPSAPTTDVTGMTGRGYRVVIPATLPPAHPLATRQEKLVRGPQADGFYLSCHVRPPAADPDGGPDLIPLLLIGPDDDRDTSICGLYLRKATREEQKLEQGDFEQDGAAHPWDPPGAMIPRLATWEVIGYVNDTNALPTLTEVSSFAAPRGIVRDEAALHDSVTDQEDIAWPMAGGRWEEIGLLFDREGRRLVLYRNGVRVGEHVFPAVPDLADGDETVLVGSIDDGSGPRYAEGILDEISVHRLAKAEPVRLPADILPVKDYAIVAHPDGRVEVDRADAVDDAVAAGDDAALDAEAVLEFSGSFNQASRARISVSVDGRVAGAITP
jgi:prepilin-type N-terminal cleavage/methylation domain-containing protein